MVEMFGLGFGSALVIGSMALAVSAVVLLVRHLD